MPSLVKNSATEKALRKALKSKGYTLSPGRKNGDTGVDILAKKEGLQVHIEVIGHKSSAPARSKDFFESFFRAVSRLKDGASRCVIAMPNLAKRGLPLRAKHYGQAWTRISDAFPELEIWLVDVKGKAFVETKWSSWAK